MEGYRKHTVQGRWCERHLGAQRLRFRMISFRECGTKWAVRLEVRGDVNGHAAGVWWLGSRDRVDTGLNLGLQAPGNTMIHSTMQA